MADDVPDVSEKKPGPKPLANLGRVRMPGQDQRLWRENR